MYLLLISSSPECHIGALAGDEETYEAYSELFDPIIRDYYNGFQKEGESFDYE